MLLFLNNNYCWMRSTVKGVSRCSGVRFFTKKALSLQSGVVRLIRPRCCCNLVWQFLYFWDLGLFRYCPSCIWCGNSYTFGISPGLLGAPGRSWAPLGSPRRCLIWCGNSYSFGILASFGVAIPIVLGSWPLLVWQFL